MLQILEDAIRMQPDSGLKQARIVGFLNRVRKVFTFRQVKRAAGLGDHPVQMIVRQDKRFQAVVQERFGPISREVFHLLHGRKTRTRRVISVPERQDIPLLKRRTSIRGQRPIRTRRSYRS